MMNGALTKAEHKIKKPGLWRFILLCVLVLQVLLIIGRTGQRSNYYVDELFSFGSAHTYTFERKDAVYVTQSDVWTYEKWIDNAAVKKELYITPDVSLNRYNPLTIIKMLLLGRNYHGILNLLMSAFSPDALSPWPPLVLNLILFVLAQVLLYRTVKDLTGSFPVSLLAVFMYGFSAMCINTVMYIRFYMLVIFLLLAVLRLHQRMWKTESLLRHEIMTVASLVLLYLALRDSELVFILGGALVLAFAAGLALTKQFRKILCYLGTIIPIALWYLLTHSNYLSILLHPAEYISSAGAESGMVYSLLHMSFARFGGLTEIYRTWINNLFFGSRYVGIIVLFFLVVLFILRLSDRKGKETEKKEGRPGFVWIIAAVYVVYQAFVYLTGLTPARYTYLLYPLFSILLATGLNFLLKGRKYAKLLLAAFAGLFTAGILISQIGHPENLSWVYAQDRPAIEAVEKSGITDCIAVQSCDDDGNHALYDCFTLMPDSARLFPLLRDYNSMLDSSTFVSQLKSSGEIQAFAKDFPDRLLVWIRQDRPLGSCEEILKTAGYSLKLLGSTHASDIYIAQRSVQP